LLSGAVRARELVGKVDDAITLVGQLLAGSIVPSGEGVVGGARLERSEQTEVEKRP
jgi:hypothetical protein